MSYYDDPMETGEIDPYAMDQAMVDFMIANGVGAGMVPDYQMSGKPLTVANQTSAINAYRSSMFDTAFQGLGGPQAFAPGAFEPTISTTIRQEPELQQVYSYLRSPTSMEGIITQELMAGGTPATAQRNLRQLLTASDEEVAAIFAEYDALFNREPTVTVADVPQIKANLLLELPPAFDEATQSQMTVEADGTGADWNSASENSVLARAGVINELNAQIPRIGPSGPKWGTDPTTGQPMQISAGGELQWSVDETGSPVMIEITETPSEAAQTFTDLGLPTPADEYGINDFLSPGFQETETQYLGGVEPAYQEAMQNWLTANETLRPTMQESMTPYNPDYAPGWSEENRGDSGGVAPRDPGVTPEEMAMVDRVRQNALAPQGGPPPPSILDPQVIGPLAEQLIAEGQDIPDHWTYTINPDGSVGEPLPPEYQAGGPAGQSIGVTELMRRRAAGYDTDEPAPPGGGALDDYLNNYQGPPAGLTPGSVLTQAGPGVAPPSGPSGNPVAEALDMFIRGSQPGTPGALPVQPDEYAAGSPASYEQFLAQNPPLGPPRTPAYARPGAQPANQPGGPGFQPGATQSTVDALLAQLLPGNQQRSTNLPAYAQQRAQPANQPGGPGFQGGATQSTVDAMLAQILPGNRQQTMNQPPAHLMPGAQPANQPGGPQYMEEIETGERRAAQRQEDEQNAQVLGGTTDRTGTRRRATRTGEQARQYRYAHDQFIDAFHAKEQARQQTYGYEYGAAAAQAGNMRRAGIRPLDQALMARRLVLMNAGMPQGI